MISGWANPFSISGRHKLVCNGTLTLRQAQAQELAYKHAHG